MKIFFDTNVFRHIGRAFRNLPLPNELRRHIVVSPISAIEVLTHLTTMQNQEVLQEIQAMHNWIPIPAILMPMPTYVISEVGFSLPMRDEIFDRIGQSLNVCFYSTNADELKEQAGKLKDFIDEYKAEEARILEAIQHEGGRFENRQLRRAISEGLAMRVGTNPKNEFVDGLEFFFETFFEYEIARLTLILRDQNYNPHNRRNRNDALDSEQLIYLCNEEITLLTCDTKFRQRVVTSRGASRIHTSTPEIVRDSHSAIALLRELTGQHELT